LEEAARYHRLAMENGHPLVNATTLSEPE
jgi:hypothetical protein